jgi:hypothetical protein
MLQRGATRCSGLQQNTLRHSTAQYSALQVWAGLADLHETAAHGLSSSAEVPGSEGSTPTLPITPSAGGATLERE